MSKPVLPFRTIPPRIAPGTEWVLARYRLPYDLWIGDHAVSMEVVLCVELPLGVILVAEIIDPAEPVSLAEVLRKAIDRPMQGKPRRPGRIRVRDESVVAELQAGVGEDVPVVAGPTPEADEAFDALAEAMRPRSAPSYLAGGVDPALIERLFLIGSAFHDMAPWKTVAEQQMVRVDIPSLGVDGACLSIIGDMEESRGLLLFRSGAEFERFATEAMAAATRREARSPVELLSLNLERKRGLPPSLLNEIEKHRWPVNRKNGYPMPMAIGSDGLPREISERDIRILIATASAFLAFFARNSAMFAGETAVGISESFTGDDDMEVTITAPYLDDAEMRRTVKPRRKPKKKPRKRKK